MAAAMSRPGMRRRITRDTDAQRAGQDAIHSGVGGEDRTARLEIPTQLGLEVAGDGDDDGRGPKLPEVIDELELLLWSEGCLQDDHVVRVPGTGAGVGGADRLGGPSKPRGCSQKPLHEQKFVGYYEQTARHGCRIAGWGRRSALLAIAKSDLALAIIAPGESWVEGQADHSGETSEIQRQQKGDSP